MRQTMDDSWRITLMVFSVLLGAAVGSFLNVCIYRLPRSGLGVSRPRRSFCPSCGSWISWRDNIPLVSWFVLGGRCRYCQAPISPRYVAVEALTAALFAIAARRWVILEEISPGAALACMALCAGLVVASFIDLELRLIPDEITLGGILLVPAVALLVPDLHGPAGDRTVAWAAGKLGSAAALLELPAWCRWPSVSAAATLAAALAGLAGGWRIYGAYWRRAEPGKPQGLRGTLVAGVLAGSTSAMLVFLLLRPELWSAPRVLSFWTALWGMLVGAGLVYGVGWVGSRVFRKPAMGLGDVKLLGLLGAFTGWVGVILGFFVACLLGSIAGIFLLLRYRSRYLPFGPFLALGCLLVIFWPGAIQGILDWYLGLFR